MTQEILAMLILCLAAVYLIARTTKVFAKKKAGGCCGGGCGCKGTKSIGRSDQRSH